LSKAVVGGSASFYASRGRRGWTNVEHESPIAALKSDCVELYRFGRNNRRCDKSGRSNLRIELRPHRRFSKNSTSRSNRGGRFGG
jgi:hypothetical protein